MLCLGGDSESNRQIILVPWESSHRLGLTLEANLALPIH